MQKPFRPLDAIGSPSRIPVVSQGIKQQHIVSMRQKRLKLFSIHISFIPIHVLFRKYPVFRQRPSSVRQSCGRQVISLSIFVTPLRSRKDVRLECCAQLCRGRSFFVPACITSIFKERQTFSSGKPLTEASAPRAKTEGRSWNSARANDFSKKGNT